MRSLSPFRIPSPGFRFFLLTVLLTAGVARAEKPESLRRAWREYQFLSLDVAEKFFAEVLGQANVENAHLLEAKVGLAMVYQYRERNADPGKSEALYAEALAMAPAEEVRNLIRSNLADLHLADGRIDEAEAELEHLIQHALHTVVGQDALRRWVVLKAPAYGTAESVAVAGQAADWLRALEKKGDLRISRERPMLLPVLHAQLGDIYFRAGEYERAVVHYEAFSRIGSADTTSYASQASNLYRLAKIYEQRLNDPVRAGASYLRLVQDLSNSNMAYYALERAVQLGALNREEAEALQISGLTDEILDELFEKAEGGD